MSVALWAYWHAKSFEEGLFKVVNAGGDADTNAAVECAIMGAKFGFDAISQEYVDGLVYKDQLEDVVESCIVYVFTNILFGQTQGCYLL